VAYAYQWRSNREKTYSSRGGSQIFKESEEERAIGRTGNQAPNVINRGVEASAAERTMPKLKKKKTRRISFRASAPLLGINRAAIGREGEEKKSLSTTTRGGIGSKSDHPNPIRREWLAL